MKVKILTLFLLLSCVSSLANINSTNDDYTRDVIVKDKRGSTPHIYEPIVTYNTMTSTITVDFGTQPVNSFVVTISSLYTDVDYYATSSFTTIPLAPDGFSDYSIVITTAAGDVFEGTLTASDYTTSEMY